MGCGSWVAASSAAQCSQCDGKRSTTSSTRSARVHGAYRDVLAGHRAFGSRPSPHACARCSRPERQARALLRDARGCPAMRAACSAMRTSCSAMRTSLAAICASRSAIRRSASTHNHRSCPRGLVDRVLATDQNDPAFRGPERIPAGWHRRCATLPGFRATCLARRRPTTDCSRSGLGPPLRSGPGSAGQLNRTLAGHYSQTLIAHSGPPSAAPRARAAWLRRTAQAPSPNRWRGGTADELPSSTSILRPDRDRLPCSRAANRALLSRASPPPALGSGSGFGSNTMSLVICG